MPGRRTRTVELLGRGAGPPSSRPGVLFAAALASIGALGGCSSALPRPPATQVAASDYVPVPFSPRAPPVEFVPPKPAPDAVWVDGSWEWYGRRYGWRFGSWVVPPSNTRHARWVVVRRREDGQLFFAPSTWKDTSGKLIEDPAFVNALGARARARSRLGAPAPPERLDGRGRPGGPRRGRRGAEEPPPDAPADTVDQGDSDEDE